MSKWINVRLSDMFTLQMGKTPSRNDSAYWCGVHKWVSIADLGKVSKYIVNTKECITDLAVSETGIKITPKNTVVMSFKLSIGKTAITTEEIYTNEAIMSFIDKGVYHFDIDYIYHLFSGKDWSEGTNKAVMGVTLNKATLSQISIPLPPLEIQRQIADNLDKVTHIIDLCNAILEKLDLLVKSRFVEMFGDININNKKWNCQPLGELCTIVRGGSPRPIENFLGGDIPWIKIGDATNENSVYLTSTKEHIIKEGVKKSRLVKSGSLIFANCGVSLGFARIITFDGCIHDGWLAMEDIDERLDKIFLLQSLNQMTEHFRKIAPAGTQPNLNTTIMKEYKQIIPPIEIQKEFISFIEQVDKSKLAVKQVLDKAEILKNALMQEYFG